MRKSPVIILSILFGAHSGCSDTSAPDQKLSIGGTYSTAVSMSENTCGSTVSIQPMVTVVTQTPGAASFTLVHGVSYSGTVAANGSFTAGPTVVADPSNGGIQSTITIAGQFNTTGFIADATVNVLQSQQPNTCRYVVHWIGTKQGAPNIIP